MIGYHTIGVTEKRLANDACMHMFKFSRSEIRIVNQTKIKTYGHILEPVYQTLPLHHCPYHQYKFSS